MNQDNPDIQWKTIKNKEHLYFTFDGTLTLNDATLATKKWTDIFKTKINGKITIVWNCLKMSGYEPMARSVWQKKMKELKNQIDIIWLITDSSIVKAGANIMSVFTSYEIKTVKSEDEIKVNLHQYDTLPEN